MLMRLGTETGSLVNHMMSGRGQPEPAVGMGATIIMWSDRHACTIVSVKRFATGARAGQVREVSVRRDRATRTDTNGMSEIQEYAYEYDPDAPLMTYRVNKRGEFRGGSTGYGRLSFGHRSEYRDYSF